MKRIIINLVLIFFILAIYSPGLVAASTGIGIILGEPTGLSFRMNNFPVAGLGWSFNNYIHFHCDYWIINDVLKDEINWYIGAGGKLLFYGSKDNEKDKNAKTGVGFGFRVPVGLQYYINKEFELFCEVAPGIRLVPAAGIDINGGIGIRYQIGGEAGGKAGRGRGKRRKSRADALKTQQELLEEGLKFYRKKRYKGAREVWRKCNRIDPSTEHAKSARQYIVKVNNILKSIGEE